MQNAVLMQLSPPTLTLLLRSETLGSSSLCALLCYRIDSGGRELRCPLCTRLCHCSFVLGANDCRLYTCPFELRLWPIKWGCSKSDAGHFQEEGLTAQVSFLFASVTGFKISQTDAVSKVWVTGVRWCGMGLKPTNNKEAA